MRCLTNDLSYFELEKKEATETKTLFFLFPHFKNTTIYLRIVGAGGEISLLSSDPACQTARAGVEWAV